MLTTGTDEHGQKVERSAQATGQNARRIHGDRLERVPRCSGTASASSTTISSARPTRATMRRCAGYSNAASRTAISIRAAYTGQYCVSDEFYVNDAKPGDNCPTCGRPTETITEENYFFKLSAFAGQAAEALRRQSRFHPARIAPQRSAELRARRLAGPLDQPDHLKWGIPLAAIMWYTSGSMR